MQERTNELKNSYSTFAQCKLLLDLDKLRTCGFSSCLTSAGRQRTETIWMPWTCPSCVLPDPLSGLAQTEKRPSSKPRREPIRGPCLPRDSWEPLPTKVIAGGTQVFMSLSVTCKHTHPYSILAQKLRFTVLEPSAGSVWEKHGSPKKQRLLSTGPQITTWNF